MPQASLRPGHEEPDAIAYATECERYCRLLEHQPTAADIRHAQRLKAVTADQASQLLSGLHLPATISEPRALTIIEAARMHPSSGRELTERVSEAIRHERELRQFCDFAKITDLEDVRLETVQAWVADLKKRGVSWDGRRHCLLWLRRSTRMGTSRGIPDILAELALDRRDRRSAPIVVWTLEELIAAALQTKDARVRVAIGFGGLMGMRPSEIFRVEIPHIEGDLVRAGDKNESSRRLLPMPAIVGEWVAEAIGSRKAGPLLQTAWHGGPRPFNEASFNFWLAPLLEKSTGKRLGPKHLRKSFSTWALRTPDLPAQHVEAFMGHRTALASLVTGRHYLAELVARELRPTAKRIDRIVRAAIKKYRPKLRIGATKPQVS